MTTTGAARKSISNTADLDVLSAVWILSCNDENPIITYRGITTRLALPESFDVRALVKGRRELFRPGASRLLLDEWKENLKIGKALMPSWITDMRKADQAKAIADILKDDVFRNQFRGQGNAERCSLEVVKWGLEHVERLRKSAADDAERASQRWSAGIIPALSILLAALTIYLNWDSANQERTEQRRLKVYEVSLKPKQEAYSRFMYAIMEAEQAAVAQDQGGLQKHLPEIQQAYFLMEPFLSPAARSSAPGKIAQIGSLCVQRVSKSYAGDSPESKAFTGSIADIQVDFEKSFFKELFPEDSS